MAVMHFVCKLPIKTTDEEEPHFCCPVKRRRKNRAIAREIEVNKLSPTVACVCVSICVCSSLDACRGSNITNITGRKRMGLP